jgi:DNA polymerase-1
VSDRTLLIAATNLLARGFLVVPTDRKAPSGAPVNGLFAVARAVLHVLDWKAPARAVAVVDRAGRQWPDLLVPQLEQLPTLLRALGVCVVEAQDEPHVLASYAQAARDAGDDVVIVGVDKRFAQLVADDVWWYDANKDARYTPEIVKKRFGVPPAQVADWLALVGDDDQVPGVSGIGAKGATQLLAAHGQVEAALANLDSLERRPRKALEAAQRELPQHLAHARLDRTRALPQPLSDCAFRAPEPAALNVVLEALGFVELLVSVASAIRVHTCQSADELSSALSGFDPHTPSLCALIDELDPPREAIRGVALSTGHGEGCYVPVDSPAWPALLPWLERADAPKTGHDLVAMRVVLARAGVQLAGIVGDSACASHLVQPSGWAPHELPLVARHVLGRSLPTDTEVLGSGAERTTWQALPPQQAAEIACQRADASAHALAGGRSGIDG